MTKRNERTSPRVAKIAAKVLAVKRGLPFTGMTGGGKIIITWEEFRAIAASCLAQSADKPKRAPAKRSPAK